MDKEIYRSMQESCIYFIRIMWRLIPQPVKPEYRAQWEIGLCLTGDAWQEFADSVRPFWFDTFVEGKHITWQQSLVLYGIDKYIRGDAQDRISIVSGHGIGKSCLLSWIILWGLFTHPQCQIACTSPTATQIHDILWKEIEKWIGKLPKEIKTLYDWQASYVRMREDPNVWFARAKTASKENPEALAGVHGPWVFMACDEASGIEEPIFNTMEGALTGAKKLVFLISNGTRTLGYFYDTHHKDKTRWQRYSFDSEESPRVDYKYVEGMEAKHGRDSVEFKIRVKGQFPDEGVMDDKGWTTLFNEADLHFVPFDREWKPVGRGIMALDPSGEGQDTSEFAVRDRLIAGIVASEQTSNSKGLAIKGVTLAEKYEIDPYDWVVDAFGVGHDISMEVALVTNNKRSPWRIWPINGGETCDDDDDATLYINKRAEGFYKMRNWCRAGGTLMESPGLKEELLSIRMKRTANGKVQIMDKVTMKKLGIKSPNKADALSMTFLKDDKGPKRQEFGMPAFIRQNDFDPYDALGD